MLILITYINIVGDSVSFLLKISRGLLSGIYYYLAAKHWIDIKWQMVDGQNFLLVHVYIWLKEHFHTFDTFFNRSSYVVCSRVGKQTSPRSKLLETPAEK